VLELVDDEGADIEDDDRRHAEDGDLLLHGAPGGEEAVDGAGGAGQLQQADEAQQPQRPDGAQVEAEAYEDEAESEGRDRQQVDDAEEAPRIAGRGGGRGENTATTAISETESRGCAQPGRPGRVSIPIDRAE
jgi:hypothetical protein